MIKTQYKFLNFSWFIRTIYIVLILLIVSNSCKKKEVNSNNQMIEMVNEAHDKFNTAENMFSYDKQIFFYDSLIKIAQNPSDILSANYYKANVLLNLGKEKEAIENFVNIANKLENPLKTNLDLIKLIGLAHLRLGERQNCLNYHSTESCIFPIQNSGIHVDPTGSVKAIEIFKQILGSYPQEYETQWLLNIAYMTIGGYPSKVPKQWLIPNLDLELSKTDVKAFTDIAPELGLNIKNMSGGLIVDDFNNDNYMDIITSEWDESKKMRFFVNDKNGKFIDMSIPSGLSIMPGGLNLLHADYDNDGDNDVFVLRGAWKGNNGEFPNSLLRNNGDNTFTDVTIESGLFSKNPTQTAVWRDFNNDGWLDLYIGNETPKVPNQRKHPSELYISLRNGKFKEVSAQAGCKFVDFTKGVSSGDFDHDGKDDLFISSLIGETRLLRNSGNKGDIPQFIDVTKAAGLYNPLQITFPTWFWDYDNDGWLDIFICGYNFGISIAHTAATEALHIPNQANTMYLYKNNHNGTFTDVTLDADLKKSVFGMGSNFGDIDNDGYPDMYIGTGNPILSSLVPNRLFRNTGNGKFEDITISARVGNLQKGHGVAFTDLDNDGDQDIFVQMGGPYPGDEFYNSFYLNPGQNNNHWIRISLEGTESNRSAIGAKIKLSFMEAGKIRNVYSEVKAGGSFGDGSFRRELGCGQAQKIDEVEIYWPVTQKTQSFKNINVDQFIKIKENENEYKLVDVKKIDFKIDFTKRNIMCKK
ncbi:MAG: FG-GAP-like repeat-containing protein [Saprospiraceae bacterium]